MLRKLEKLKNAAKKATGRAAPQRQLPPKTSGGTTLRPASNGKPSNFYGKYGKNLLAKINATEEQIKSRQIGVTNAENMIKGYHTEINDAVAGLRRGLMEDLNNKSLNLSNNQKKNITGMITNSKLASREGNRPIMAWNKLRDDYTVALKDINTVIAKVRVLLIGGELEAAENLYNTLGPMVNKLKVRIVEKAAANVVTAINKNAEANAKPMEEAASANNSSGSLFSNSSNSGNLGNLGNNNANANAAANAAKNANANAARNAAAAAAKNANANAAAAAAKNANANAAKNANNAAALAANLKSKLEAAGANQKNNNARAKANAAAAKNAANKATANQAAANQAAKNANAAANAAKANANKAAKNAAAAAAANKNAKNANAAVRNAAAANAASTAAASAAAETTMRAAINEAAAANAANANAKAEANAAKAISANNVKVSLNSAEQ